jgi:hypothetical protein
LPLLARTYIFLTGDSASTVHFGLANWCLSVSFFFVL